MDTIIILGVLALGGWCFLMGPCSGYLQGFTSKMGITPVPPEIQAAAQKYAQSNYAGGYYY